MCYVAIRPIKRPCCYIVHDVQINSLCLCVGCLEEGGIAKDAAYWEVGKGE